MIVIKERYKIPYKLEWILWDGLESARGKKNDYTIFTQYMLVVERSGHVARFRIESRNRLILKAIAELMEVR